MHKSSKNYLKALDFNAFNKYVFISTILILKLTVYLDVLRIEIPSENRKFKVHNAHSSMINAHCSVNARQRSFSSIAAEMSV